MNEPHPSSAQLGPGMMLGQAKYQVVSLLGSGGMGDVYLGRHLALDREVAIKVLRSRTGLSSTEALARFRREALLASRLEHPNVVRVLDFDEENGTAFIVMDLVRGDSLFERVVGTRLELDDLVGIMEKVCAALEAAHRAGLLHRDLKPENILLEPFESAPGVLEERVKVCDFGLAKAYTEEAGSNPHARSLTRVGEVSGTPEYMSPEQARGERLDPRSDLYSVGTIVFHLAAGKAPYTASSAMAVLMQHVNSPVPRLCDVVPEADPRLERLITKAMAKEPRDRFQTAAELRSALLSLHSSAELTAQTWLGQHHNSSNPSEPTTDTTRLTTDRLTVRSPRARWAGFAVAALLCFGLGLWVLVNLTQDDQEASSATPSAPVERVEEREPVDVPVQIPSQSSSTASVSVTPEPTPLEPSASEPAEFEASANGRANQAKGLANNQEPEQSDSAIADRPVDERRTLSTQKTTESGRRRDVPTEKADTNPSANSTTQPSAPTLRAKASVSHVKVQGGEQGPVEQALEKERGQFEACYRSAAQAARRDAEQTLEVRFSVVANTPADVRVLGAELLGLNDCMRNSLRRMETSSLPDEGRVEADIHLTPLNP